MTTTGGAPGAGGGPVSASGGFSNSGGSTSVGSGGAPPPGSGGTVTGNGGQGSGGSGVLHEPVVGANKDVVGAAEKEAALLLQQRPKADDFIGRVRELIDLELKQGNASVEAIFAHLGVHRKILTRHLKAGGTTFQRLLAELRYEHAERWLREPGASVGDVAVRLGYADASAFNKAFKRWTGTAPQNYRQKNGRLG